MPHIFVVLALRFLCDFMSEILIKRTKTNEKDSRQELLATNMTVCLSDCVLTVKVYVHAPNKLSERKLFHQKPRFECQAKLDENCWVHTTNNCFAQLTAAFHIHSCEYARVPVSQHADTYM